MDVVVDGWKGDGESFFLVINLLSDGGGIAKKELLWTYGVYVLG